MKISFKILLALALVVMVADAAFAESTIARISGNIQEMGNELMAHIQGPIGMMVVGLVFAAGAVCLMTGLKKHGASLLVAAALGGLLVSQADKIGHTLMTIGDTRYKASAVVQKAPPKRVVRKPSKPVIQQSTPAVPERQDEAYKQWQQDYQAWQEQYGDPGQQQ